MTDNYRECYEYLAAQYEQVNGCDFYREIFPNNENSDEHHTDFSHPNAIFLYPHPDKEDKMRRCVMYNDTWEDDYMEYVEQCPQVLCGGLAYRKRENKLANAQCMNALIFDLDGVGGDEIQNLFLRLGGDPKRLRRLPMPTYIVLSGNGLHLYYVFKEPIDLYPNIKIQLKSLKYDLTFRMWEYKATSQEKSIQYQSINQSFRMVGSVNEKYDSTVVAFRTGDKVTLDYMNAYATKPENRVDVKKRFRPSKMTKEQAKESYPEWYQRVIVEGDKRRKKWDIAGKVHGDDPYALYHWWLRHIGEVKGGHRYFYMMCLAIYAYKCDVPKEKLEKDIREVFNELQKVEHKNALREVDIQHALETYDKEYYNFTIDDIEALTDVNIKRNKRNGQKQAEHLEEARAIRDIRQRRRGTKWTDRNGRPSAELKVVYWREEHPDGRKIDCERETGLSRPTVLKWWDCYDEDDLRLLDEDWPGVEVGNPS